MKKALIKNLHMFIIVFITAAITVSASAAQPAKTVPPQNLVSNFGLDAETGRNFTWVTFTKAQAGYIEYCQKNSYIGFDKENIIRKKAQRSEIKTDRGIRVVNKVELTGLKPSTDYIYRVGSMGNFSREGFFRTAGMEAGGFTFINITDTQGDTAGDYAKWKDTLDKALEKFPDARFLVHTGDMVDDGQKIWHWDSFLNTAGNELMSLPIAPAVGNHEMLNKNKTNDNARNFTYAFDLPNEADTGAPAGTVYSFDYANAHIAVMNTQCGSSNLKKQAEWLRQDMKASDRKWKIVALHRGPYGATYDTTDIRRAWTPVFDETGVDLVLQGHDHNYVRSFTMKNGKRTDAGKGTVYITGNTGGVKYYPKKTRSWQEVDLQPKTRMYVAVTVKSDKLDIRAYDKNNELLDSVTIN